MSSHEDVITDEETLSDEFSACEDFIDLLEAGRLPSTNSEEGLSKTVAKLEWLTISVTKLAVFSSNESYEELPTQSLNFMLLPAFLGVCHQNKRVGDPTLKISELNMAKVYFRDYLKRLREYSVFNGELPWEDNDDLESSKAAARPSQESAEAKRQDKIERFRRQQEYSNLMMSLREKRASDRLAGTDDDGTLRELYLAKLRFWWYRALAELEAIQSELPMLEHMKKLRSGDAAEEPAKMPRGPPRKPFIITRDAAQKAVFGLGYPSVPVMTVDEWYDQRFGEHGPGGAGAPAASDEGERPLSDSEGEDDGRDAARRERAMRWDEYKDTHRRGWGNTHNKG